MPAALQAKANAVTSDETARFILKGSDHAGPSAVDAQTEPLLWQIDAYQRFRQP
jgi:hypothetical protein